MKNGIRVAWLIICVLLGALLVWMGAAEIVDSFWSGMGGGLIAVGVLRLVQANRIRKDQDYREAVEIEAKDERNIFIHNKAWAWAGYLFIMVVAVLVIVLKVLGEDLLSLAASVSICLLLALYSGAYLVIRKKY